MNRFWIRLYNNLDCEIEAHMVKVPEGKDHPPYLHGAIINLLNHVTLEPGDSIRIEAA